MIDPNYKLALRTTYAALLTDRANSVLGRAIRIGETPARYLRLGFPELPLAMKVGSLEKMLFRHGIPLRFLEGIYGVLLHPRAVFRSHSQPHANNAVVLSFESNHLGPIVAVLHADKSIGRVRINELASVYAKEDRNFEQMWRTAGLLLWETSAAEARPGEPMKNRLRNTTVRL